MWVKQMAIKISKKRLMGDIIIGIRKGELR